MNVDEKRGPSPVGNTSTQHGSLLGTLVLFLLLLSSEYLFMKLPNLGTNKAQGKEVQRRTGRGVAQKKRLYVLRIS